MSKLLPDTAKFNRRYFLVGAGAAAVASVIPSPILWAHPAVLNPAEMFEQSLKRFRVELLPLNTDLWLLGSVDNLYQMHIDAIFEPNKEFINQERIDYFAKHVVRKFGPRLQGFQFGMLYVPKKGIVDAKNHTGKNVSMRSLVSYRVITDAFIQRFDVIFRPIMRKV